MPSGSESRGPEAVPEAPLSGAPESTASGASSRSGATPPESSRTPTEPEAEAGAQRWPGRPEVGVRHESQTPASPRPQAAERAPRTEPAPGPAETPPAGPEVPEQPVPSGASGTTASVRDAIASPEALGSQQPSGAGAQTSTLVSGAVAQDAAGEGGDAGDGVFKVRLANFEGPFDLLLQLISKHKMDVTEVALSKVTDEFMAHIRAMGPDWDLDETTEFLVVAATLLDLKAARLLPAAEVEDEADLALLEARDLLFARLLQYRAYKQIAEIFNERLEAEARRYPRTVGLEPHHAELLPEVVISIGPEGFAKLAVKAMQPKPKPQVYVEHIHAPLVSVQEQAGIVVARLKELGEASFRVLVQDTEDTLTVVARFLALLELYREKAVELDQETALGDLLVRWTGGDEDTAPVVTDEFDRPVDAVEAAESTEKERKA
ncbi:segregation/condensation protein A [Streptomyces sp. AC512_CC834]|uniref:segregation and condensation protein A n=1 Tax=Streptomyces sp. AC512_CC834 TaxID=2823691 RepID=UPI0035AE8319